MIGELKRKVDTLEGDVRDESARHIGSIRLSFEIEKAIKTISLAIDLNSDEITTILSDKPGDSLSDVSYWLRRQSAHDRASF